MRDGLITFKRFYVAYFSIRLINRRCSTTKPMLKLSTKSTNEPLNEFGLLKLIITARNLQPRLADPTVSLYV